MTAGLAASGHYFDGLASVILLVALVGILFLIFYALKNNNVVKAIFSSKLFSFSLETEKISVDHLKK
jgi:hypothetical protein